MKASRKKEASQLIEREIQTDISPMMFILEIHLLSPPLTLLTNKEEEEEDEKKKK